MKFSYKLIKKYLPDAPSKESLIEALVMHSFEAENMDGDVFDVSVPSNRYSSASYHIGVAREAAAVLGLDNSNIPNIKVKEWEGSAGEFGLEVKDKDLCTRYTGMYFENVEVGESPEWVKEVLKDCGLRPINNVVDVMNYVMLETGQPLHAFDYDKIEGKKIVVRNAKEGESMTSIEGIDYDLDPSVLVIADEKKPLAIAGIKGGKDAEVTKDTERIVVEAANFDPISIYKTSNHINLSTDASLRFSHDLHKRLALEGLKRAADLLKNELGFKPGGRVNSAPELESSHQVTFDLKEFNKLMGTDFEDKEIVKSLSKLGLNFEDGKVEVPPVRDDVWDEADLIEEAGRIFGFDDIGSEPPKVSIKPSESDEVFDFRDDVRKILIALGYDEVYNYSFVGDHAYGDVELENPISEDKSLLRKTLTPLLFDNVEENLKHYDDVRIFEIGKVFEKAEERNVIGIAFGSNNRETLFEVKGVVSELLEKLGLMEFHMVEVDDEELKLEIHSDHEVIGEIVKYSKGFTLTEIKADLLMELVEEEISFEPMPKYPAVLRDVSILVSDNQKIGDIIKGVQEVNLNLIEDVDLVDEYFGVEDGLQSITLRIRFRSDNKTLSSKEVDKEMEKVVDKLEGDFGAEIR